MCWRTCRSEKAVEARPKARDKGTLFIDEDLVMNIYLIYRGKIAFPYDTNEAHVIAASNTKEVVKMARDLACDEGAEIWNKAIIECVGEYKGEKTEPTLILTSFHAG